MFFVLFFFCSQSDCLYLLRNPRGILTGSFRECAFLIPGTVYKVVGVCLSGVSLNGSSNTRADARARSRALSGKKPDAHRASKKWHFLPLHTPDDV